MKLKIFARRLSVLLGGSCLLTTLCPAAAQTPVVLPWEGGSLQLLPLGENGVRIRYCREHKLDLPEWIYVDPPAAVSFRRTDRAGQTLLELKALTLCADPAQGTLVVRNRAGDEVFRATRHTLTDISVAGTEAYAAELTAVSPADEHLFGLGQFQDGIADIRGLSRRLTQVNTQISIPFLLSDKGYGLLWNNYGLTEFNPCDRSVALQRAGESGDRTEVNVTSTQGGKTEIRTSNLFRAELEVPRDGLYTLLLDVGQRMARRHHLAIDGRTLIELHNLWLPPTASTRVMLTAGRHEVTAQLEQGDQPVLYYAPCEALTRFRSPVADAVDYTIFVGDADAVIAACRQATGAVPELPKWALGYIHCRERFHSQEELLATAREFRERRLPVDVLVQDWQYWGRYGWNAMRFDEEHYPDPAAMVRQLHDRHLRLMLSVWSRIDPQSEPGRAAQEQGYYIPDTQWIDFFNPEAADFYWNEFSRRLLRPYRIDAWWQDATEPENDDLLGRRVMKGTLPGEAVRNVYPLLVNRTVYEGCRRDDPERRTLILTRCGFPGIQRYGAAMWSGDVGNDWETLRRQIVAGLGMAAAGMPWWTFDAGGFFRPADQHTDPAYIERMLRWIQTATFLPLMRVHGYMSDTEPWRYGETARQIIAEQLDLRYRLLPYLYSEAVKIALDGSTLMRPMIFDFAHDPEALRQECQYLFGPALLVHPVTEPGVKQWRTYLPAVTGGWYDFRTRTRYAGGKAVDTEVAPDHIPVFVRAGAILPMGPSRQHTGETPDAPLTLCIYPGADGSYTLYEDEGDNYNYEKGMRSEIRFAWNDAAQRLTISKRKGSYPGMPQVRQLTVVLPDGTTRTLRYDGRAQTATFGR